MPTGNEHHSSSIIKLLNVGESGTGKSGALVSLLLAGYNVWMLDYDNGADVVINIVKEKAENPTEVLARFHYETLRDTVTFTNGIPRIKPPTHAYKDAGKTLATWGAENFTDTDIISLDTLSTFSSTAFNEALMVAGRLNQRPQQNDYGWMADSVLLFIEMLTSPELKCHVIVNTHVRYFAGEDDTQTQARGLPNAKGQQVPTNISRYFNTVLLTRTLGHGPAAKRVISTQPQGVIEVKTSSPFTVKPTYPVETGLADLFRDILGHGPSAPGAPPIATSSTLTPPATQEP